ncbi:phenylalanine--tRNA ligase subunit beta [Candidatus Uhrbacteria bacterium]|nr:phenylalanine--tRNA ligase subunit beta [Candidatus Uhrbacteria bacterium]
MNILASYNWIKEYLDTDLSAEDFARKTTAAGNSVEHMDRVADRFANMIVGFVKEVKPHPNADKLQIAQTDIGKETVEIVCGGVNLTEGMRVIVGLPGARVKWHGEGELVELVKTKIRGVESHGMICAVEEIGFEKLATGKKDIWNITALTDAKPGTPIVQALELDEVIFDIEVTSNRPDCRSIIGQAREGAAVTSSVFVKPALVVKGSRGDCGWNIEVKEPVLCPKYSAVLVDNIKVGPSPWWLQKKLLLAGYRPINNVVDITNVVLHEYGQPLHAFDADKLYGEKIVVRKAKKQEKFLALDGKDYELSSEMLVIADAKNAVAVAGVMGGEFTGTTEQTTRVLIESATFDSLSVRRTARALNLYSDSQLLFEKGLSVEATGPALERAIELLGQVAGGNLVSDVMVQEAKPYEPRMFPFDPSSANRLMGLELSEAEMREILERLGFEAKGDQFIVPYWRDRDIENSVDFVEEIARVYGYDRFPSVLPSGDLSLNRQVPALVWTLRAKTLLSGMGLSEVYSYSFVSESQLERFGVSPKGAVLLRNPLSAEFAYMRPSLIPSLLTTIEQNQARFPVADFFELAPVYTPQKNGLPQETLRLVFGVYGKDGRQAFLRAKGFVQRFFRQTGLGEVVLKRLEKSTAFHLGRSATVVHDKHEVGTIGQVSQAMAKMFGLDVQAVVVDLDFEKLVEKFTLSKSYKTIPQFPSVKRDLAFVVSERVEYASVVEHLAKVSPLFESVELFDVYRGQGVEEGKKSLALHFSFRSDERTLESKEVDAELETFRTVLQNEFGAMMRS